MCISLIAALPCMWFLGTVCSVWWILTVSHLVSWPILATAPLPVLLYCNSMGKDTAPGSTVSPSAPVPRDPRCLMPLSADGRFFSPQERCISLCGCKIYTSQTGMEIWCQKLGFSAISDTEFCALTCFLLEKGPAVPAVQSLSRHLLYIPRVNVPRTCWFLFSIWNRLHAMNFLQKYLLLRNAFVVNTEQA